MLMGHDSYMRFTLASWRRGRQDVRFPFASGVGSVRACIFKRFSQGFLEDAISQGVPDVFVEQFPECRLDGSAHKYLDDNLRAAAAFGRAEEPPPGGTPPAGGRIAVRAVFGNVRAKGDAGPVASLLVNGRVVARRQVMTGVKRAVFFGPVECPDGADADAVPVVELSRGSALSTNVSWRILPDR